MPVYINVYSLNYKTMLFIYNILPTLFFLQLDGSTMGDGSTLGLCPTNPPLLRCLSSGECRICKQISANYEGCDYKSAMPICDANSLTGVIEITEADYNNTDNNPVCTACKKAGKYLFYICNLNNERLIVKRL